MSQYFRIGTDPASVKWSQIKTPHFKIIYPRVWESKRQYIANGLEYNYLPDSRSLYHSAPRTPVIIHNQTTVPSSVTYIAPRRMEFITAPPQDLYPSGSRANKSSKQDLSEQKTKLALVFLRAIRIANWVSNFCFYLQLGR